MIKGKFLNKKDYRHFCLRRRRRSVKVNAISLKRFVIRFGYVIRGNVSFKISKQGGLVGLNIICSLITASLFLWGESILWKIYAYFVLSITVFVRKSWLCEGKGLLLSLRNGSNLVIGFLRS